jgi:N-acetylglucosaminyl-diphospho-decaprenol L-rhamnosyltransferase
MARVAAVIVTYNSAAEVGGCLDALRAVHDLEVVVVDNASADSTREEVNGRGFRLIANSTNAGFAAAVNQGVRATTAPLILLLNPDAHLMSGLEALAVRLETSQTGAVGGKLVGDDGKPQSGFMARSLPSPVALIFEVLGINKLFPRNRVNWHYRCLGLSPMAVAPVDQPAGAFLMFSRCAWEAVAGFDERFWPVWFEDVDFCARIKNAGFRTYYDPEGIAKHSGAHSIRALTVENRERYWYGSLLKYAEKHYCSSAFIAVCGAVAAGAVFRGIMAFPRTGFRAFAIYGGVIGLAFTKVSRSLGSLRASVV